MCYEASGAGYVLQRALTEWGIPCDLAAPSLIPRRPGEHQKTDRRDALKIARDFRDGRLVLVHIPTEADERVRDLVRCRETFQRELIKSRHYILKFQPVTTIEISERTYQGLQNLARPFIDTPDDVIRRLLNQSTGALSSETQNRPHSEADGLLVMDPTNPADLTHTRIIQAAVDGEMVRRPNWNRLVHLLHIKARNTLESFDALARATRSNVREGRFEERGFVYVPEADISIQGVESRLAWENTLQSPAEERRGQRIDGHHTSRQPRHGKAGHACCTLLHP